MQLRFLTFYLIVNRTIGQPPSELKYPFCCCNAKDFAMNQSFLMLKTLYLSILLYRFLELIMSLFIGDLCS